MHVVTKTTNDCEWNKIYIFCTARTHNTQHTQTDRQTDTPVKHAEERKSERDADLTVPPGQHQVCVCALLFIYYYLSRWIWFCSFSGEFHVVARTHEKRNGCVLICAIDLKCQARIWTNFRDSMFLIGLRVKQHWIGATCRCTIGFQSDYDGRKPHTPMVSSVFFN